MKKNGVSMVKPRYSMFLDKLLPAKATRLLDYIRPAKFQGTVDPYRRAYIASVNQFVLDHDLYPNFQDRDDFILTYPFVPYQFRLISDVFQSFSQIGYVGEGVKNTERAILGITHFTANICNNEEVGYFVPFDQFFNESLRFSIVNQEL